MPDTELVTAPDGSVDAVPLVDVTRSLITLLRMALLTKDPIPLETFIGRLAPGPRELLTVVLTAVDTNAAWDRLTRPERQLLSETHLAMSAYYPHDEGCPRRDWDVRSATRPPSEWTFPICLCSRAAILGRLKAATA